jgi:hypothetical protein
MVGTFYDLPFVKAVAAAAHVLLRVKKGIFLQNIY